DPLTELINQKLGPDMQRANEIYVKANATVIDDPAVLSDIEVPRNTLLLPSPAVSKYWSLNKGRKSSNCYSSSFRSSSTWLR
ncbi:hypothetical protein NAI48_11055, partial [Francisella tularensis subsp. holarctica]|nr:hypothetical protein [Francisella tularensis subsp. holarctica]